MEKEEKPASVAAAVDMLYANMGFNDVSLLAAMREEDLIDVQVALGYHIGYEFGLATGNTALLESCRKSSGDMELKADDAVMLIVKILWEKAREANITVDYE